MGFFGFDTETLNGFAVVVATDAEFIKVNTFQDILEFLCKCKHRNSILWTWNLRFDIQAILKHLLTEQAAAGKNWREIVDSILLKDRKRGYNYKDSRDRDFKIKYIQGKQFHLSNKKNVIKLYDIAQFYGFQKLETAAQDYLKRGKQDSANWVLKSQEFTAGKHTEDWMKNYLEENLEEIGKYCSLDAELTKNLAEYMEKAFLDSGIPFDKPLSQAKIAEQYIKNNYQYPFIPPSIEHFHTAAELSFHGGIFETLQRGFFKQPIWDYDINSAYPATMSTLPHWANGSFYQTEKPSTDIRFGWYLTEFDCRWVPYEDRVNPYLENFVFNIDGEQKEVEHILNPKRIVYPEGPRKQFITRVELDFLNKHGYKNKVLGGVEWQQLKDKFKSPFSWMKKTYYDRQKIKQENKNDMRQYALKILLNSSYGKTAQQEPFKGPLTNFFYASYITSETRVKLAEIAERNKKYVVDIATDGICLTREDKNLEIDSSKLGAYSLSVFDSALFIGSGIRQMFNSDGSYTTYARGLTNDRSYNMLADIKNNLGATELKNKKFRPLNLGECATHINTLDLKDLNVFTEVSKTLSVNTDKKHNWSLNYVDFEEFLNCKSYASPLTMSQLI